MALKHGPSQVFSILFSCMVIAQLSLVYWKKKHRKSYQQVATINHSKSAQSSPSSSLS